MKMRRITLAISFFILRWKDKSDIIFLREGAEAPNPYWNSLISIRIQPTTDMSFMRSFSICSSSLRSSFIFLSTLSPPFYDSIIQYTYVYVKRNIKKSKKSCMKCIKYIGIIDSGSKGDQKPIASYLLFIGTPVLGCLFGYHEQKEGVE